MFKQERLFAVSGVVAVVFFVLTLIPQGDSPRELYETAKKYERLADTQRATDLYRKVVANHPDTHFARYSSYRLQRLHL